MILPIELFFFLLIELAAVAWIDLKYRKISNLWSVMNLVIFLLIYFLYDGRLTFEFQQLYYPIVFLLLVLLFTLSGLWVGIQSFWCQFIYCYLFFFHENFLFALLYVTIFIGLTQLAYNTYVGRGLLYQFIQTKNVSFKKMLRQKIPICSYHPS